MNCRALAIAYVVFLLLVGVGGRIAATETYDSGEQFLGEWLGTICRDGSYSTSTGSGTCSWHGGVLRMGRMGWRVCRHARGNLETE